MSNPPIGTVLNPGKYSACPNIKTRQNEANVTLRLSGAGEAKSGTGKYELHGTFGKNETQPAFNWVKIDKTVKIVSVSGNNLGFVLLCKSGGEGQKCGDYENANDPSAIGKELKPGMYCVYPVPGNVKGQTVSGTATVKLTLQ